MSYEPLHHKYRPQTFADLVGQNAIATTLTNAILTAKIAPAYLFSGPRGTGKTSSARILAKSLNCLKSDKPTEQPCGVCEVCKGIANGSALDVIEIDAASNTGVDNIREIIERAQFAPVQCRYKVYVIDECLTGDSLVQTSEGLIRIDDPNIKGKKVLSYNESSETWEFKKVVRWLDQGERQTLVIKTTKREIRCTGNHLIRTDKKWVQAKDITKGMKILSPVNADVVSLCQKSGQMDSLADTLRGIKLGGKAAQEKTTTWMPFSLRSKPYVQNMGTRHITTSVWALTPVENGSQTSSGTPFPAWTTSLETVESVTVAGVERVYDIEVADNHNFVANGLLLHNCHMLSQAAFNALLKTLEEPPDRVVFVLATTDPQRVLPTIISRCQRFDFRRIPLEAMVTHLKNIASKENINITHEAVQLVAQVSQGGLRDAESLLDQLSLLSSQVTVERVWDLVGSCSEPDLMALLQAIAQSNPEAVLDCARQLMDRGREPLTVLQNLTGFYRDLLIAKTVPSRSDLVAVTPLTWKALCEEAVVWDVPTILAGQQHLAKSEVQIKNTTQPRLWLEVTLLGLLPVANHGQQVATSVPVASGQPIVSPPEKGHRQTIDASMTNIAKQRITSDGSQKQPLPDQAVSASESQPPVQRETPQPIANQGDRSERRISEPTAEVEHTPSTSQPLSVANSAFDTPREQWQQVLAHLQPTSTQQLLRQMGHLIDFDGTVARIGMKTQALCNRAKVYLPNIKAAFQETFKREVQVSLELATRTPTKAAPVNESRGQSPLPQALPGKGSEPGSSPEFAKPVASHLAATSSSQAQAKTQFQDTMTAGGESTASKSESPKLDVATYAPANSANWEEDEVAISAQRLADFFSGEVIKLKDDPAISQPVETNSLPPQAASEWDDPDTEIDF